MEPPSRGTGCLTPCPISPYPLHGITGRRDGAGDGETLRQGKRRGLVRGMRPEPPGGRTKPPDRYPGRARPRDPRSSHRGDSRSGSRPHESPRMGAQLSGTEIFGGSGDSPNKRGEGLTVSRPACRGSGYLWEPMA